MSDRRLIEFARESSGRSYGRLKGDREKDPHPTLPRSTGRGDKSRRSKGPFQPVRLRLTEH